ncbi:MAG: hypothetical protein H0V91_13180 [Flavisolibacter sp.]|nr:hypothetical protein [Flavisolibacter sp.]
MKPLLIILTVISSFFTKDSAATECIIDCKVLQSFESQFTNAKEVDWSITSNIYKAQFALDGQYINAFFSADGELVAMTKNVSVNQLPLMLQTELKKQTAKYWITELFELSNEEGTSYYVTLENADEKVVLHSVSNKNWNKYKKTSKI